jgi:hypothetical protein
MVHVVKGRQYSGYIDTGTSVAEIRASAEGGIDRAIHNYISPTTFPFPEQMW